MTSQAFDHSMVAGPAVGDLSPAAIPIGRFQSKGVCAMKLTSAQVERALGQIEAQPIPDDHPVVPQLNELFGEHTFFLDSNGLNIVEPAVGTGAGVQSAKLVNLASWNDDDLEPHEPEPTDVIIVLESRH
jgi:hypothetical protein